MELFGPVLGIPENLNKPDDKQSGLFTRMGNFITNKNATYIK